MTSKKKDVTHGKNSTVKTVKIMLVSKDKRIKCKSSMLITKATVWQLSLRPNHNEVASPEQVQYCQFLCPSWKCLVHFRRVSLNSCVGNGRAPELIGQKLESSCQFEGFLSVARLFLDIKIVQSAYKTIKTTRTYQQMK